MLDHHLGGRDISEGAGGLVASARGFVRFVRPLWSGRVLTRSSLAAFYRVWQPHAWLPRKRLVSAYAGANACGFNAALVVGDRGVTVLAVLTNANGFRQRRAEDVATRIGPLVFPRGRS